MPPHIEPVDRKIMELLDRLGLVTNVRTKSDQLIPEIQDLEFKIFALGKMHLHCSRIDVDTLLRDTKAIFNLVGPILWPNVSPHARRSRCPWLLKAGYKVAYPEELFWESHQDRLFPNFEKLVMRKVLIFRRCHRDRLTPAEKEIFTAAKGTDAVLPYNPSAEYLTPSRSESQGPYTGSSETHPAYCEDTYVTPEPLGNCSSTAATQVASYGCTPTPPSQMIAGSQWPHTPPDACKLALPTVPERTHVQYFPCRLKLQTKTDCISFRDIELPYDCSLRELFETIGLSFWDALLDRASAGVVFTIFDGICGRRWFFEFSGSGDIVWKEILGYLTRHGPDPYVEIEALILWKEK